MFAKLQQFREEHGHCRVPKNYSKDVELSNWVRNQRLEYCNLQNGKRSRMTPDRFELLDSLGFRWSISMPSRNSKNKLEQETDSQKPPTVEDMSSDEETNHEQSCWVKILIQNVFTCNGIFMNNLLREEMAFFQCWACLIFGEYTVNLSFQSVVPTGSPFANTSTGNRFAWSCRGCFDKFSFL